MSLVWFAKVITTSLRRSERQLLGGRGRDSSGIALTISQRCPKGLGRPAKQEFPKYTIRKFPRTILLGEFVYIMALPEKQDSA